MQYVSGRRINQDFGVPGITTNDTVVNVDGRIAVGIGTSATTDIDTNQIRIRDNIIDSRGVIGSFGYFLTKDEEGLTWTNVPPLGNNSIFLAEDGDILNNIGLQTYTGLNFISDQLLGITTNSTNPGFADIRIDPRWFRDRTPGGGGGIYTTGTVGIGLTQPRLGPVGILTDVKLDVLGDAIFSGIISATSFIGEFNVDTKDLNVSGIASFNGTTDNVIGDTNTGIVQINGGVGIDKNVSIGASLDVNNLLTVGSAVTIGNGIVSATTGDFINLELDNLNVTGFSTFGNTARFNGAVNIFDDLFVSGNISVGGTGVTLDTESIRIEGKELLIGFTTTITPNDTTANAGGIAVASTEGYSLVDLQVPGINTTSNTYKQFKWFKSGTFVGQSTDAFISNQPISIGGTQIQNGQLFAVGDNINFTENQITAPTFVGNLTGTASTASFATTAFTLDGRVESEFNVATAVTATNVIGGIASVTQLSVSGVSTLGTVKIDAGIVTATSGIVTYFGEFNGPLTGTASTASFATTSFTLDGKVESEFNVATAVTATNVIGGIASVTQLSVSGISTLDGVKIDAGIVTATSGIVTYYGDGQYLENTISGVGIQSSGTVIGTGFTTLNFIGTGNTFVGVGNTINISINSSEFAGFAQTAGIATNLAGGAGGQVVYQSAINTTAFLSNGTVGQVLISNGGTNPPQWADGASTGAIDGITVQDEGSIVGSGGSISTLNFVGDGVVATASGTISTITINQSVDGSGGIANTATNVIGGIASVTQLSVSGISTLGTVEINSGIITATSGIVTYYGDGQYLDNIITETEISNQSVAFAQTAGIATNVIGGIASVTQLSVSGISTLGTVKISAGIITSTTGTAVTYFGNLTGTASTASFATTAFTLNNRVESDFNVAFAQTAGIATNVIGGIASVTQLSVSGISTLGTVKIDAGIITSTTGTPVTYFGNLTGVAATASFATTAFTLNNRVESDFNVAFAQTAGLSTETTKLQTARTFELTGDVVASPISFDGTGNVSLAATIQPNSVALGGDTTGNYVESISGTGNQITVTAGTGEGSTPVISIPDNPTLPGTTVTIATDLQVNRNLNVTGNITIGGTTAFVDVERLRITDADIVLGYRTDSNNNDASNDTTASHGGIAVASTEGSPLISLIGAGETLPITYKKIMWFESGAFTGLATDAWLTNYAFGVGTTSMSAGTKFAVGNIETDFDDITSVRNINASGIVTATGGFVGNLTGTASTASFATTAFTLNDRVESEFNVATAVTATNLADAANITTGTISASRLTGDYNINITGVAATASFATTAFTLNNRVESEFNVATAVTATNLADAANITTGTISASRLTGDYNINITGVAATASFATTAFTLNDRVEGEFNVATAVTATNLADAANITTGTISASRLTGDYNINITGVAATASFATTAFTLNDRVEGEFNVAFAQTAGIATNVIGGIASVTSLSVSGVSTLGTVKIDAGIVTATSGIVTYYGDGSNLTNLTGASAATYGNATNVAQVVVDANGRITGISNVAISGGGGGDTYQFNTGVTSSISLAATGIGITALTLPSTAGKQYTIYSINASNVATGNTEVNFIGAFDFSGGERSYFAYNIPVPTGLSIELLKQPQILNPLDRITIRSTDFDRNGVDDIIDVYITYKEETSSDYFGVGIGTVGIAVTSNIGIYTSSTYPSVVQSIRVANRTDVGGKPISIAINNGIRTTYLIDNLIVPKYASIELLETPKRLNTNDVIEVQVDETETIDIQISGKKITS